MYNKIKIIFFTGGAFFVASARKRLALSHVIIRSNNFDSIENV